MRAMIMAAGLGTRLRPFTESIAKSVFPFLNYPLFLYPLYYLKKLGVREVVFNLHHLPKETEACIRRHCAPLDLDLDFYFEPEILGTGGGLKNVESFFEGEENFIVVNGDALMFISSYSPLQSALGEHLKSKSVGTFITCPQEGLGTQFGALWTKDGSVQAIGKTAPPGLKPEHFTGWRFFSERIWEHISEGKCDILTDAVLPAISRGLAFRSFFIESALWFETGDLRSYLEATFFVLKRLALEDPLFIEFFEDFSALLMLPKNLRHRTPNGLWLLHPELSPVDLNNLSGSGCMGPGVRLPEGEKFKDMVLIEPSRFEKSCEGPLRLGLGGPAYKPADLK